MLKKILAVLCAVITVTAVFTACSDKSGKNNDTSSEISSAEENSMKKVMNEENVKLVGRTWLADNDTLWCALSGSGAEFEFTGKKLDIMIEGDTVSTSGNPDNYCRLAIYVDGERAVDDMLDDAVKKYTPIDGSETVTKTVKIVKLSECAMSTMGIMPINLEEGASIKPVEKKSHSIEFIGDSITCGYGVDDEDENHSFKTSTEDVTKAYAYKTAQALDAEYSMFSTSGYGIISGWTGDGTKKEEQSIPQYYKSLGFSYGNFGGTAPQSIDWDFSNYQPELIVINLGTNDDSYCGSDDAKQREYIDGYKEFLSVVREKNPDAHIICSLGIMGGRLYTCIEEMYLEYKKETGDENISIFKFDTQNGTEDGYAADWHPTEKTHDKAAEALEAEIRTVMGW